MSLPQTHGASRVISGRLLWFDDEPSGEPDDTTGVNYLDDGALAIRDGIIAWTGDARDLPVEHRDLPRINHQPHLILPGFIDTHIHFPQAQVVASYAGSLLEWLNRYTFVEEQRFADPGHAEYIARQFFDLLVAHGTTTAVAYCSVHKTSAEAFFAEALRRNMRMAGGKVMMDRNAPPALTDTAQSGHDDSADLIARFHGQGRLTYAISPRFALTSTEAQLEASGALARAHPDCLVQTHMDENHAEIATVAELFPWSRDYADVYERYGLLGPNTLLGHCIHLKPRERAILAETGSVAVFCPTSNLFLGSGLYDLAGLRAETPPVRSAIATDIGGGTSWSMLRTLDEGYKVLNLQGQRWHPYRSFWLATQGNARAIGMADRIGSLAPGHEADLVVLNAHATRAMALRMETVRSLEEELFLIQTMGDDRAVEQVYVMGEAAKPRAGANPFT